MSSGSISTDSSLRYETEALEEQIQRVFGMFSVYYLLIPFNTYLLLDKWISIIDKIKKEADIIDHLDCLQELKQLFIKGNNPRVSLIEYY